VPDPNRERFSAITGDVTLDDIRDMSCCARSGKTTVSAAKQHASGRMMVMTESVGGGPAFALPLSVPPAGGSDRSQPEDAMAKNDDQEGKQPAVEGRHGDKTHSAFLEGLQGAPAEPEVEDSSRHGDPARPTDDGRHRLREDREQHDEAEKNSEFNRLSR